MQEFRPPAVVEADADLVRRLRSGDDDAARELVDRQGPIVYALAVSLAGPERAADLSLHVFVQAWRNSEAVEPGRSLRPWLAVLTVRVAVHEGIVVTAPSEHELTDEWVSAQVGEPATWPVPPLDLRDRVANAVLAEAFVADAQPGERGPAGGGRSWVRPALIGVLGTLVFLFVGTVVFSILGGADGGDERTVELVPTGLAAGAGGEITVTGTDAGLRIEYDAVDLERRVDGTFYEAWVTSVDGSLTPVGSFNGGDDVVLTGAVELPDAAGLTIALSTPADPSAESRPVPVNVVARAELAPSGE